MITETFVDKELMDRLKEAGVYFQVNTSSIMGHFGKSCKKRAKILLKKGYVDFIATDCHDMATRKPNLKECLEYVEKKHKQKIKNVFK
jgi:protein-tyrosine phosphatase